MATEADLRLGAAFVAEQLKAHPGKRVFIHCKGGIGRAATMAVAHLVLNKGAAPEEAARTLKAARSVVAASVAKYPSVQALRQRGAVD